MPAPPIGGLLVLKARATASQINEMGSSFWGMWVVLEGGGSKNVKMVSVALTLKMRSKCRVTKFQLAVAGAFLNAETKCFLAVLLLAPK